MGNGFLPIKQVVHPERCQAEVVRMVHAIADQVMHEVIRMGKGADRHAPSAVGTDFGPIGVAALWVDLPAQSAVFKVFTIAEGNCL